jgi:ankyrin repeat protein
MSRSKTSSSFIDAVNEYLNNRDPDKVKSCFRKIKDLLERSYRDIDVDVCVDDINKQTALHLATQIRDIELMRILLKYDANPNVQDAYGKTAMHILLGLPPVPKFDEVANPVAADERLQFDLYTTLMTTRTNLKVQDKQGNTALHLATNNNAKIMLRLLSDDMLDITNEAGRTILQEAIFKKRIAVVKVITEYCDD